MAEEKLDKYIITGRVIDDRTKEPIKLVTVLLKNNNENISWSLTDENGMYNIEANLPSERIQYNQEKLVLEFNPTKNANKKRYQKTEYTPLTSEHWIKSDIPPIGLKTLLEGKTDEMVLKVSKIPKDIIDKLTSGIKTDSDWIKKFFKSQTSNISVGMIPVITELLVNFGINDINKKKTQCPPKDEIINIVRKRNNLVKALNSIYKATDIIIRANVIGLTLIKVFKIVQKININIPIPIIEYTPHSLFHKRQEKIKEWQKYIDKYEGLNETILMYVFILRQLISQLLRYLKVLDESIKDCYLSEINNPDNPLFFDSYLDPLLEELQSINLDDKDENGQDYKRYFNGFEIKVINVDNNIVSGLHRRQAVALNKQGIIMIRGEESFSSSDEILKEQLIFYININNLKAY